MFLEDIEKFIRDETSDQKRTIHEILLELLSDVFSQADDYPKVEEVDELLANEDEHIRSKVKMQAFDFEQCIEVLRFYSEQFDKRDNFRSKII
jgi:hypothetical protein